MGLLVVTSAGETGTMASSGRGMLQPAKIPRVGPKPTAGREPLWADRRGGTRVRGGGVFGGKNPGEEDMRPKGV